MIIKGKGLLAALSALGLILAGAGPVLAESHGGGGGHASAGGHGFGGASHAAGAAHFASPAHYAGGVHYAGAGVHGYPAAYHGTGYVGHGAYGYPGHYAGHGYSTGAYWGGGYWHGGFWPRAYYGWGFSWFLPILPLAYATYWYGGIPYYYANNVYYTYDPAYSGYVATDPPPVGDPNGAGAGDGAGPGGAAPNGGAPLAAPAPGAAAGGPGAGVPGQIFMYPKNGQSAEQTAIDKAECQKWATAQAGQVAQNGSDYNRAMVACVEGRGYSAR
jgi:hypothetical protein